MIMECGGCDAGSGGDGFCDSFTERSVAFSDRSLLDALGGAGEVELEKGEVDQAWHRERGEFLRQFWSEPDTDERMRRTSRYTLLEPIRFWVRKAMLARLEQNVRVG